MTGEPYPDFDDAGYAAAHQQELEHQQWDHWFKNDPDYQKWANRLDAEALKEIRYGTHR